MCVQLLLQFKCVDRVETCHCLQFIQMRMQVVYIQYSVTLISITFLVVTIDRLLPMSHIIDCWYVHGF